MSIELMTQAWTRKLPSGQKLTLLALCNLADVSKECWPTVATLAQVCGMSERSTQEHLAALEEVGYVARRPRQGFATIYSLTMPKADQ